MKAKNLLVTGEGTYKFCARCDKPKSLQEFSICTASASGRQSYCSKCSFSSWRIRKYGTDGEEIIKSQNGKCAIPSCDRPATDLDHDHVTKEVRSGLCGQHNMALGLFGDNPQELREAAEYIEFWRRS